MTVLPLVRTAKWWVRVWDYPRSRAAMTLGVMLPVQVLTLPTTGATLGLLVATLACLAWQPSCVYPYTRLKPLQVARANAAAPDETISLLIANVLQENRDAATFLRRIEETGPDIILAVETSSWWDAQLAILQKRYPHAVRHPQENTYGMHLFSRLELQDVRLQERVAPGIPSIFARVRLPSDPLINLYCVRPEPP